MAWRGPWGWANRGWVLVTLALGAWFQQACSKQDDGTAATPQAAVVALQKARVVSGTPLSIQLPKGWVADVLPGADAPIPDGPAPGVLDLSQTREVWKASVRSPTGRVDPFVLVTMDARLPAGTNAVRYLEALRAEQSRSSRARVRHIETERIERDGRTGYSLRDAMDAPLPTGGSAPLVQVARLFVDGERGFTVTCMALADDLPALDAAIRAMMESVRFVGAPSSPLPP